MIKTILMMILCAINASCWWSIFTGNVYPNIIVSVVLFTIFTTAACVVVLALNTLDKPPKK